MALIMANLEAYVCRKVGDNVYEPLPELIATEGDVLLVGSMVTYTDDFGVLQEPKWVNNYYGVFDLDGNNVTVNEAGTKVDNVGCDSYPANPDGSVPCAGNSFIAPPPGTYTIVARHDQCAKYAAMVNIITLNVEAFTGCSPGEGRSGTELFCQDGTTLYGQRCNSSGTGWVNSGETCSSPPIGIMPFVLLGVGVVAMMGILVLRH
jgi:hypothetical protein